MAHRSRTLFLPVLGLLAIAIQAHAAPSRLTVRQIREKALASSGADRDAESWVCVGDCNVHGANEKYEFDFKGPEFVDASTGVLKDIAGYDGSNCWVENWAGIPHFVSLAEKDQNVLVGLAMSGEWAKPDAPLELSTVGRVSDDPVLSMRLKGGQIDATLTLDGSTYLPKTLKYWTESGDEIWTFAGYRSFSGRKIPTGIYHAMTQQTDIYSIQTAKPKPFQISHFAIPKPDLTGTHYDMSPDRSVPFKQIDGYMFVHPLVNGEDLGWFFLDSGAEVMCLDTAIAKQQGLREIGSDITAGVVAVTHLPICRADTFQLGPVEFDSPTFYELDMSGFAGSLGIKVAGICGFDFVGRTSLDIDPVQSRLSVYAPGAASWPQNAQWTPFIFNGETPCVECEFEGGHRGFFSLDTGSDSTVDFFSPIVRRLDLLKGRTLTNMETGGAGGNSASKQGKMSYFEIGGRRFNNPSVGLQITKQGVYASPFLDGNVGMGFLGKFRLLLDYSDSRIGFIPVVGAK